MKPRTLEALDALRRQPMKTRELATALGISQETAGFYLWELRVAGLAECVPRRGPYATWRVRPEKQPPTARVSCVWDLGGSRA